MASVAVERPVIACLRPYLACAWTRDVPDDGPAEEVQVLPDACIDIVWQAGGALTVTGPDTGPAPVVVVPGTRMVGVRFRPGTAPAMLGLPADALRDLRVDLADLWGRAQVEELAERLARASEPASVLEEALHRRLPDAPPIDPVPAALAVGLDGGGRRLDSIAAGIGLSERQLRRRCESAVGFGPKMLDRVLRFRRFLALVAEEPASGGEHSLAGLALAAGYADQAHLTRECRRLAGATPAALQRAWARSTFSASIVA